MGAASSRQSLALAVGTGAFSVIPLWRAPRPVRTALVAGTGLLASGAMFAVLSRPDAVGADREPVSARVAATVGAATGMVAGGAVVLGLVLDREAERFLVRHGVRRPRLVLATVGGALSYALDVLDRRMNTDD